MSNILYLGPSSTAAANELLLHAIFTDAGHTVEHRDDADANKTLSNANGTINLVIIGEGTSTTSLAGWTFGSTPLLVCQHTAWDDFGLMTIATAGLSDTDVGDWLLIAHPITTALGLAAGATVVMYSGVAAGRYIRDTTAYQDPASGVQYVSGTVLGNATDRVLWTFEAGVMLADGLTAAPARRAGMTLARTDGPLLTAAGKNVVLKTGEWLVATAAPGDTTAPTAPTLTATVATNDVTLEATGSADAVGVTAYRLHRSTVNGFTPSGTTAGTGTCIAVDADGTYVDIDLADGTYYYRAYAIDAAGNVSTVSNQATATVNTAVPVVYFATSPTTSVPAELWYTADGITSVRVDLA